MNIILIEDHPIFRIGVRQLVLQHWPEANVVEAGTLAEALVTVRGMPFQFAIVDLNLPDTSGLEVLSQLVRAVPKTRVLVLSFNSEAAYAQRALQMGAAGYLAKDHAANELITALERIAGGGRYITASLAEQLADLMTGERKQHLHEELSAQEYRVLIQLAQGQRVGDIAEGMNLSPKTISTYRSRVLEKLQLASNAELARYCVAHALINNSNSPM